MELVIELRYSLWREDIGEIGYCLDWIHLAQNGAEA
jgi:hypothetical protein